MSNGEEDEKGTAFTKEAFKLLKQTPGINFVGNVEGRDLFETELDVVLCDGFVGNIMLKTVEATAKAVSKWLKTEIKGNPLLRNLEGDARYAAFLRKMRLPL